METYNLYEAKTHFSKLIERVCAGEEILIARHGVFVAKIVPSHGPATQARQSLLGRFRGKIDVPSPEDDARADAEIACLFKGKEK